MSRDYQYTKTKHPDSVQHIGIRKSKLKLETTEVIVGHDGTVRINESVLDVPSNRLTRTLTEELDGDEGAQEARRRIDEMFYYSVN